MLARLDRTLLSMEGLERYNGHFYNWYDTLSGQPLPPKYISTVDSGNLAGHLVALKNGCLEALDAAPLLSASAAEPARPDRAYQAEVGRWPQAQGAPAGRANAPPWTPSCRRHRGISRHRSTRARKRVTEWVELASSLVEPTVDLATAVRRLGRRAWVGKCASRRRPLPRDARTTRPLWRS